METSQETCQPSQEPSMLEYVRFHKLSEDYMHTPPIVHADWSCEPIRPVPPEGLLPVDAKSRMEEVDRIFCTGIMMERLPARAEDMDTLRAALQPKLVKGNIWRGLLPVLKTSDLGPVPVLQTAEDEETRFAGLQGQFSTGPFVSASVPHMSGFPVGPVSGPAGVNDFIDPFVPDYEAVNFPRVSAELEDSPVTRVVVPSGPDVPVVPHSLREIFDQYNSSPTPAYHSLRSSGVVNPNGANISSGEIQYSIESEKCLFDDQFETSPFMKGMSQDIPFLSSMQSSSNPTQSENNLFDQATIQDFMFEEVSSDAKSQSMSNVFFPDLTKSKAPSTGPSVEELAQEVGLAGDVKQEGEDSLGHVLDTIRNGGDKDSVAMSEGKLNQYKPDASNLVFSSSTLQAGDQILSHMAVSSLEAKQSHVLPKFPCGQISEMVEAHTLSVAEQSERYAEEKVFRQRVEYHSPISRMKEQFIDFHNVVDSVNFTKTPTTCNAAFAGLGSLSAFMQTRGSYKGGTSSQNELMSTSASSDGSGGTSDVPQLGNDEPPRPNTPPTPKPPLEILQAVTRAAAEPPRTIFLSTDLLQTHLLFVQYMEQWKKNPPKLIYRQYHQPSAPVQCAPEADLIVAPHTGVILTTPFALTQRYPPGHGPAAAAPRGVANVVSQLRERIWQLAPRYESLFIFICRPDDDAEAARIAKTQLKTEFAALSAFCQTLQNTARVELAPLEHHPATIMMWCFGLGKIFGSYSSLFPAIKPQETESERVLRQAGLNPFAARAILDDIQAAVVGDSANPQNLSLGNIDQEASALDTFLDSLNSAETKGRYEPLVGPRVFARFQEGVAAMTQSMSPVDKDEKDIHGKLVRFD